ncbi:MAG: PEP-CTERM sorting domain-containing protein [Colwellia sp.]|uniref:lectin-like protein n=1 Tax=Colwellia sp. TaxID=56799 RepID=UPI0025C1AEBF|nr:lectin-like protein [Colwellia sp.]NQZ27080.1 PEP-CTERM sorting domain-containing protein [Colwellia sp.]
MKNTFLTLAFASFTLFVSGVANATLIQWESADGGNDHWYELTTETTNEFDARIIALTSRHNGEFGYLATITSQEEQDFIKALIGNTRAWIGASDAASEGNWIWMDGPERGLALSYTFWAAGEPNNWSKGEDYAAINWKSNGRWNDWGTPASHQSVASVVEYNNSVAVPEPSSLAIFALGMIGLASRRFKKQA